MNVGTSARPAPYIYISLPTMTPRRCERVVTDDYMLPRTRASVSRSESPYMVADFRMAMVGSVR